jgi:hypothetical protein
MPIFTLSDDYLDFLRFSIGIDLNADTSFEWMISKLLNDFQQNPISKS